MDEFQAFVTRVKQLHMSRSADADCEQNLSHDKARRRLYENAIANTSGGGGRGGAVDAQVANSEDSLLKPCQLPVMAKSLDEQQLQRTTQLLDDVDMDDNDDVPGEFEGVEGKCDKERVKKVAKGATEKDTKKSIQVMVGIDEDLKMILEMDPEIVDLGGLEKSTAEPKVMGLPPLSGR